MTQQTRLPPKKISPRALEKRMAPGAVQIGRGRFWREIRGEKTCNPIQANTRRKLHSHNRMLRQRIHQKYTWLRLQAKTSASFTTRIHQEIYQTVQTKKRKSKTTIPKRPYQVWGQKAICHATIISNTSWQKGKEIYSTIVRKCFVSRKSSQYHTTVPNQRHHIPIRESDQRNNETSTKTIRLNRDARRGHNNIQPKRHETWSPQRYK